MMMMIMKDISNSFNFF